MEKNNTNPEFLGLPSKLYKAYWIGRYIERVDSISRALLSCLESLKTLNSESPLKALAASFGLKYTSSEKFIAEILHGETPSSLLYSVRKVRTNSMGMSIDRMVKEANLLVLAVEEQTESKDLDGILKQVSDIIAAVNNIWRVIDDEFSPPQIPKDKLQKQTRHQQQ